MEQEKKPYQVGATPLLLDGQRGVEDLEGFCRRGRRGGEQFLQEHGHDDT